MKGKITAVFLCFSILFAVGISIAYYNTKTFGFDEDASIVERDDEKITVFDFDIYYNDIDNFFNKAKEIVPKNPNTMSLDTVFRR